MCIPTHTAIDVCNGSKVVADFRRVVFELTASMAPAHYMSEIDLLCSRRLIVYMCTTPYTAVLLLPLKNRVLKSHIRDHMLHLSLLWNIHKTFCRRIRCQKKNTYRSRRMYSYPLFRNKRFFTWWNCLGNTVFFKYLNTKNPYRQVFSLFIKQHEMNNDNTYLYGLL